MTNQGIKSDVQEVIGLFSLAREDDPSMTIEAFLKGTMAAACDIGDETEVARVERVAQYIGSIGVPESPHIDNVVPLFGRTAGMNTIVTTH